MAYGTKNPALNSSILANQGATPAVAAPTGKTRIINRDGTLFLVDDTGTEKEIGTGAGGTNYVLNNNAEINVTDDVVATTITVAAETVAPLEGDQSFGITSLASAGDVKWDINIADAWVTEGGIALGVSGLFRVDANAADGDWKVGVWNTTDSIYVGGTEADLKGDNLNIYRTIFAPLAAKTYELKLDFVEATTAGWVVDADKLEVTPDSNSSLVAFEQKTNWVDKNVLGWTYSEAIDEDNLYAYAFKDSNGQYGITFNGSVNLSTDTSILSITTSTLQARATAAGGWDISCSELQQRVSFSGSWAAVTSTIVIASAGSTHDVFTFSGTVLLVSKPSWFDANLDDNKINLLTQDVVTANSRALFKHTAVSASIALGADLPYANLTHADAYNEGGGFEVISTTQVKVKFDGVVRLSGVLVVDAAVGFLASNFKINGVGSKYATLNFGAAAMQSGSLSLSAKVSNGDILTLTNATGTPRTISPDSMFIFERIMDYGAFDPIGFGLATSTQAGLVYKVSDSVTRTTGTVSLTSSSLTDLTGATITLVLPTASRVAFAFTGSWNCSSTSINMYLNVDVDGTLLFGTDGVYRSTVTDLNYTPVSLQGLTEELAAGSHTIKVQWFSNAGTINMLAGAGGAYRWSAWTV